MAIRQLVEDFARYLYLPRLADPGVLIDAVREGPALLAWEQDSFAYAESFDEAGKRYRGLRAANAVAVSEHDAGLLVKPEVAKRQLEAEAPKAGAPTEGKGDPRPGTGRGGTEPSSPPEVAPPKLRRFHGTVALDAARVGRDAGRIAEEVISHLAGLQGANVRVALEIEAELPGGAPENVVRIVTENCRTLKFSSHGFERE